RAVCLHRRRVDLVGASHADLGFGGGRLHHAVGRVGTQWHDSGVVPAQSAQRRLVAVGGRREIVPHLFANGTDDGVGGQRRLHPNGDEFRHGGGSATSAGHRRHRRRLHQHAVHVVRAASALPVRAFVRAGGAALIARVAAWVYVSRETQSGLRFARNAKLNGTSPTVR